MNRATFPFRLALLATLLTGPGLAQTGAETPHWRWGAKQAIGTAYQPYSLAAHPPSRVWFSLSHGIVTETAYGLIHQNQLRDVEFALQGDQFLDTQAEDTTSQIRALSTDAQGRPLSLAYHLSEQTRDGRASIEEDVFTDPARNGLFLHVTIDSPHTRLTPWLIIDPAIGNQATGNQADTRANTLHAFDGQTHLVAEAGTPFTLTNAGVAGLNDALTALQSHHQPRASQGRVRGNLRLMAAFPVIDHGRASYDLVIGFGGSFAEAKSAADASLAQGHTAVLAAYNQGWQHYLASLSELPALAQTATDGGKLLYASAMVLKADEDKTHPGALIASLSSPWGDAVVADTPSTGYRAVWPRDFYQSATALLALGDRQTPLAALNYLRQVQVSATTPGNQGATGWFLQKTHVDGQLEWVHVQLDETAMPVMLAWKLAHAGLIEPAALRSLYRSMLKPAADFLIDGGRIDLAGNQTRITPPFTQQERWEEQSGYSPSTTAAVIAGLVSAADIATQAGDPAAAARDLAAARRDRDSLKPTTLTTNGALGNGALGTGRYFLRIAPTGQPNQHTRLHASNGHPALPEDQILDAGFLELVRYGVLPANDPDIRASLRVLDATNLPDDARVRYDLAYPGEPGRFPGWRRYSHDGYGESTATGAAWNADGKNDDPAQRGRIWPLLTGERGEYELAYELTQPGGLTPAALTRIRHDDIHGMELAAGATLMLPEQIQDGVGKAASPPGQATDSACPLVWSHAEYIKLLRSVHDRAVWDLYPDVARLPPGGSAP